MITRDHEPISSSPRATLPIVARVYQLDRALVSMIEGRISETRERLSQGGNTTAVQRPVEFVADAAGVSRSTVQRWIRDARQAERANGRSPRDALLRDFLDSFDALCRASVAPIERSLVEIASNPKHPRCVDAARFMLPRLDPIGEGVDEPEHRERAATIGDVPQVVFDDLDASEHERLDEIQLAMAKLHREFCDVLAGAAKRVGDGLDAIERLASSMGCE